MSISSSGRCSFPSCSLFDCADFEHSPFVKIAVFEEIKKHNPVSSCTNSNCFKAFALNQVKLYCQIAKTPSKHHIIDHIISDSAKDFKKSLQQLDHCIAQHNRENVGPEAFCVSCYLEFTDRTKNSICFDGARPDCFLRTRFAKHYQNFKKIVYNCRDHCYAGGMRIFDTIP